jgi:hypothetical protein
MNEDKNHINYSAADIEQYHRGALSPAAMHAMEKAALNDPFLADAMEGYMAGREKNIAVQDDVAELQQRLAERIAEKDKVPVVRFSWWKVAAVLFLFLGAGWFYITLNSKEKTGGIVQNEQKKAAAPLPTAAESTALSYHRADTTGPQLQDLAVNERQAPLKNKNTLPEYKKASGAAAPVTELNPSALIKNNDDGQNETSRKEEQEKDLAKSFGRKDSLAAESVTARSEVNKNVTTMAADKKQTVVPGLVSSNSAPDPGVVSNSFNGTVVDQFNKPVANASVQVPTLNKAFVTDNSGNFSFKAPDTALNVSVGSVGFEQQNIRLNNSVAFNQVTLKPANQSLNDVVVVGYGSKKGKEFRRKTKDFSINVLDAEPSVAWNDYTQYLEKNKRLPDETKNIHGDVVVSFTINNKNDLTDFKIEKSLHELLDAEAIRLIKEGPSWKLLKGKKAKASVIVKF